MKIGILGTGMVGTTIGTKLIQLGHSVKLGSRTSGNEKAESWASEFPESALTGTFKESAGYGEIVFVCTSGANTLSAVKSAGIENFTGKIVIDVTNPLDFSKGMPPVLIPELSNTNSLGEEVQRLIPEAYVVKTLNTVNCGIMVNPEKLSEPTEIYLCGNNSEAKKKVTELLKTFGWKIILDLGEINSSRALEMIIPFWVKVMSTINTVNFNFKIIK